MSTIKKLVLGEIKRLIIYKILPVSLVTSFIWILIFLFLSKEDARSIAPLLIYVDVTVMAILLVGASHHLEKQEGTIKSMMVMPVSMTEILAAKVIAAMFLGLESSLISSIALFLIHGITYNYILLFLFVLIAGVSHAAIAFLLSLKSKDFSSMIGLLMAYFLPFTIPTILFSFGVIDQKYEWLLMISPSHTANTLISSVITTNYSLSKIIIGCIYLLLLSSLLFKFIVYPKSKDNAVRG